MRSLRLLLLFVRSNSDENVVNKGYFPFILCRIQEQTINLSAHVFIYRLNSFVFRNATKENAFVHLLL